jgi:antitoxin CcdA
MNAQPSRRRKATNVSLDEKLVAEAKELGVNLSRACEAGLAAEVREARKRQWVEENWEAIQSSNAYFAKHGLPLAKYRQF